MPQTDHQKLARFVRVLQSDFENKLASRRFGAIRIEVMILFNEVLTNALISTMEGEAESTDASANV